MTRVAALGASKGFDARLSQTASVIIGEKKIGWGCSRRGAQINSGLAGRGEGGGGSLLVEGRRKDEDEGEEERRRRIEI